MARSRAGELRIPMIYQNTILTYAMLNLDDWKNLSTSLQLTGYQDVRIPRYADTLWALLPFHG